MAWIPSIDRNVIQIQNNKNVKLLNNNLIALKTRQQIRKSKKHNLIFKRAVSSSKSGFLFIDFLNSQLSETLNSTSLSKALPIRGRK